MSGIVLGIAGATFGGAAPTEIELLIVAGGGGGGI